MKQYLITDPYLYTQNYESFEQSLRTTLQNHAIHLACFRDKTHTNLYTLSKIFTSVCREFNTQTFIHSSIKLAIKAGAYGVHLPSSRIYEASRGRDRGLRVICSTHTEKEAIEAYELGANGITFSPIFKDKYKYKQNLEGLKRLLSLNLPIKIYALGGIISQEQIHHLQNLPNLEGFASIRYFTASAPN